MLLLAILMATIKRILALWIWKLEGGIFILVQTRKKGLGIQVQNLITFRGSGNGMRWVLVLRLSLGIIMETV